MQTHNMTPIKLCQVLVMLSNVSAKHPLCALTFTEHLADNTAALFMMVAFYLLCFLFYILTN